MERDCDQCGATYLARRATSRFCSGACRTRAGRRPPVAPARQVDSPPPVASVTTMPTPETTGPLETATAAELSAADRIGSSAGQRALALARLIDTPPPGTLGALAGWCREHGAAMTTAMAGATVQKRASTLDEVRARRDAKRHA